MFQRQGRRIRGARGTQQPARLGNETRPAQLHGKFQSGNVGKAPIKGQQFGQDLPSFLVPAQQGEEPDADRQVFGLTGSPFEHGDRRGIVEQSDIGVGPEPKDLRAGSFRARGVQNLQCRGEVLLLKQPAHLDQQCAIRLGRPGQPQEENG